MNKISKEKKEKLIAIGIGTVMICYLLHFFVVAGQNEKRADIENKIETVKMNVTKAETFKRMGRTIEQQLADGRAVLDAKELGMAPTDKNRWFFNTAITFMQDRGVNYETSTTDPIISDIGMFPKFPYQAATFGVKASGSFHDFGRFVADFENKFPQMRLTMIRMQPQGAVRSVRTATPEPRADQAAAANTALTVDVKIMTLVKP